MSTAKKPDAHAKDTIKPTGWTGKESPRAKQYAEFAASQKALTKTNKDA